MAEYIACRRCDSPDCKGCNLKRLETMLENRKFDCLMNENRSINTSYDVETVRHGRWINPPLWGIGVCSCSNCKDKSQIFVFSNGEISEKFCPLCGARMDGDEDAEAY